MTLLEELEAPPGELEAGGPGRRLLFSAVVLVLCGLLIFAHFGCHGDEDTELFGRLNPGSAILLEN
jgi:hypothetical protein